MTTAWKRLGVGAATLSLVTTSALFAAGASTATAASSAGASTGSASHGGMQVTGAFLPLPASPSVASAYLVFHNVANRADTLLSVKTSVASTSMAMSEGTTSMQMLGPVTIPAHGRVRFLPGHDHLMLEGLNKKLKVGETVNVSLRFRDAGTVQLKIPVVPLNRILGGQATAPGTGTKPAPGRSPHRSTQTPTTMGPMAGM